MELENLLLSADGDISLYQVCPEIIQNFDKLLSEFYKWKKTRCYNETLFAKFLTMQYGADSVQFVKVVGSYGGRYNRKTGKMEEDIPPEYANAKRYNF